MQRVLCITKHLVAHNALQDMQHGGRTYGPDRIAALRPLVSIIARELVTYSRTFCGP